MDDLAIAGPLPKWEAILDGGETQTATALELVPLDPIDPTKIEPRRWAYGRFLLFGSASAIGGVDGGGKSAIAVIMALAMVTGQPLLGEKVWRAGPVAIITYEDSADEWRRRLTAGCLHYGLDWMSVLRAVHFFRKGGERIAFAARPEGPVIFPDGDGIAAKLDEIGAVLLIVDPFNHAHSLEDGNSNVMIAQVAGEMSRVAGASGTAVLVLHHLRKGSSGSADDLMGAVALRATFRSCRILARMTPDIAEKMSITEPWRYVRVTGSKENYAPPPEKAAWFKLVGVPLGNATAEYPDGDDIGVATIWQPRAMFDGMGAPALRAIFDALEQTPHAPGRRARYTPWGGRPLMEIAGRSEREAGRIINAWVENGVLTKGEHTVNGNKVQRLILNRPRAAEILAGVEAAHTPGL